MEVVKLSSTSIFSCIDCVFLEEGTFDIAYCQVGHLIQNIHDGVNISFQAPSNCKQKEISKEGWFVEKDK